MHKQAVFVSLRAIQAAAVRMRVGVVMAAAVVVAVMAMAPTAQAKDVPLEQGFPLDTVLYGEVDMTGGLKTLLDFQRFAAAGAIGGSYADLLEVMRGPLRLGPDDPLPMQPKDLEMLVRGIRRVAGGLIDFTLGGVTFTFVIDHEDPKVLIDLLETAADSKAIVFEPVKDVREYDVWELKVPQGWFEAYSMIFNPRAFFRMQGGELDSYTESIYVSVWEGRYVVMSSRKNDLLDALEYYDLADDTEETLAGNRAFKDCRKQTADDDAFLFWNLGSTMTKLERIATANPGFRDASAEIYSVLEVKQFRSLVLSMRYDDATGSATAAMRLSFHNRPSWIEVLPFEPKPTALASFCPRRPAAFTSVSIDSPSAMWTRVKKLMKDKFEAVGQPEKSKELEEGLKKLAEEQGIDVDEVLKLLGSDHAILSINPYTADGASRRGPGAAFVIQITDQAKVEALITEQISKAPELREFFHVKERAFVDTPNRGKIGYRVFSSDTTDSFAWLVLDGHLVLGNQDAVREVITARVTGANLESDPEWKAFEAKLPPTGLMTSYSDFKYLGDHAESVFPEDVDASVAYDDWGNEISGEADPVDPSEVSLSAKVFRRHLPHIRTGGRIVLEGNSVAMIQHFSGLPTASVLTDMVVTMARHSAWQQSQKHLSSVLVPDVLSWVMRNGELPKDRIDFAAKGGRDDTFRDPMLAGPAVRKPGEEHAYVWLGAHEGRNLLPALPLAHTRVPSETGKYLLAMTDGSVHRVTKEQLDAAIAASADPKTPPPFASKEPQTLADLLPKFKGKVE